MSAHALTHVSLHQVIAACKTHVHTHTDCVTTHTNCRAHNTPTHTHRYKQHGTPCVCGTAKRSSRRIQQTKLYSSQWARTHRLLLDRIVCRPVFTFETVGNMLLMSEICDIHKGQCKEIMYSYTYQQAWNVSTAVGALAIPHPHQALLGFMTKEGVQQLKVRV